MANKSSNPHSGFSKISRRILSTGYGWWMTGIMFLPPSLMAEGWDL
jgi:hypothetical protein